MTAPVPKFAVIASLPVYGDAGRQYRIAYNGGDGGQVALIEAAPGAETAVTHIGPYTLHQIIGHAERVLAGEPRAMTRPDSPKILALGLLSYLRLLSEPQARTDTHL